MFISIDFGQVAPQKKANPFLLEVAKKSQSFPVTGLLMVSDVKNTAISHDYLGKERTFFKFKRCSAEITTFPGGFPHPGLQGRALGGVRHVGYRNYAPKCRQMEVVGGHFWVILGKAAFSGSQHILVLSGSVRVWQVSPRRPQRR